MSDIKKLYQSLPKMDKLIDDKSLSNFPRIIVHNEAQIVLDGYRRLISEGKIQNIDIEEIINKIHSSCKKRESGSLVRAINATGVVIHTNLGRSPIPEEIIDELKETVTGYSNLEYDIEKGKRGDRYHHAEYFVRLLTGAEDAVIVNNNAAAVFLILNTFAYEKESIVSRGELVEIGGSFRIPDVMSRSGSILKEVGTTNKTRKKDYLDACTENTALIMKVHKSNYEIVGFTEEATTEEIVETAKEKNIISYYDAGSGLIERHFGDSCEDVTVSEALAKGLDLISFSGDKMLGGPQAGIIAGKKELIEKIKNNQLLRMLRVDKITLSLVQSVLRRYIDGKGAELPVNRMLSTGINELHKKCSILIDNLDKNITASIKDDVSSIGGGSCPLDSIATKVVKVNIKNIDSVNIERQLRKNNPPIIARIKDDDILFDTRTLSEEEIGIVAEALNRIALQNG